MAKGGERCRLCVSVFAHSSAQVAFVLNGERGVVERESRKP